MQLLKIYELKLNPLLIEDNNNCTTGEILLFLVAESIFWQETCLLDGRWEDREWGGDGWTKKATQGHAWMSAELLSKKARLGDL